MWDSEINKISDLFPLKYEINSGSTGLRLHFSGSYMLTFYFKKVHVTIEKPDKWNAQIRASQK